MNDRKQSVFYKTLQSRSQRDRELLKNLVRFAHNLNTGILE